VTQLSMTDSSSINWWTAILRRLHKLNFLTAQVLGMLHFARKAKLQPTLKIIFYLLISYCICDRASPQLNLRPQNGIMTYSCNGNKCIKFKLFFSADFVKLQTFNHTQRPCLCWCATKKLHIYSNFARFSTSQLQAWKDKWRRRCAIRDVGTQVFVCL